MSAAHRRENLRPAGAPRRTCRGAVAALLYLLGGCAVQDYAPALLPAFTREHLPAAPGFLEAPPPLHPAAPSPQAPAGTAPAKGDSPAPPEDELPPPRREPASLGAPVGEPVQLVAARLGTAQEKPASEKSGPAGKKEGEGLEELPSPRRLEPSASGISLDEAIEQTLRADPKLRSTWEAVNLARGELLTSSLLPNPALILDGQLMPLTRPFTVDRQGGPPQADMQIGWAIDWFLFGKRAAAMASARLGVEVSAADYADQLRQRVAGAIAAYYDLLEAQALRELARQDVEALRRIEEATKLRVKFGGVAEIDIERARLAVLDSQRELRRRETVLSTTAAALRTFLGRPDVDPAFRAAGSLEIPSPAPPLTPEEALALADLNRPDLIALRRQLAKAEADIHTEHTKGYPTLTPSWDVTRQFQTRAIGFPDATSWGIFVNLSVPLFDRNQGNVRKAEATRAQTFFNLQTQFVNVRGEIEQAAAEYRAAHTNATTSDPEQLRVARRVRDSILEAYRLGRRSLLEVLDAERAYRDTYRLYISGQSAYWHALYRLNAAIGKQVLH
jgi:outer membrane protein, heavy metal efflux system